MHEVAICEHILQIMEEQAMAQQFQRVSAVWLELGPLSCVEPEALRFSFDAVTNQTLAEGAILNIVTSSATAHCPHCRQTVAVEQRYDPCPRCGLAPLTVCGGDELRIKQLEVS
jgi:hydrogenase nickel incorporation protein HypA/HybF